MRNIILIIISQLISLNILSQENVSPYYIFPRQNSQHIDLSDNMLLTSKTKAITSLNELNICEWFNVSSPTSIQRANYLAGKLPDPYMNLNLKSYKHLENNVWYYKKTFEMPPMQTNYYYLLNFDGLDYFSKIWLNGKLIAIHEGMFGGPNLDITKELNYNGKNELIIEDKVSTYGKKDFKNRIPENRIRSWYLSGAFSPANIVPFGLWRNVRIEVVPFIHMERPYLVTDKIEKGKAFLNFSMELFYNHNSFEYSFTEKANELGHYYNPLTIPSYKEVNDDIKITISLTDENGIFFTKTFSPRFIDGRCWMEEQIVVENPQLWFPNGFGQQHLYQVLIVMTKNNKTLDQISFDYGIRKIEFKRNNSIRTNDRWNNWQIVVNGKEIFAKGVNWMPLDILYDLNANKYDWELSVAKNLGIHLIRVWGGGYLEDKAFYDACNRYGIMVWQDFPMANTETPEWPQKAWESQICQNIFRLRNEPSLIIWCGGNEFSPYIKENTASIGILERDLASFDPNRPFFRSSPDGGSNHCYPDYDPVWYKQFKNIPFFAETGIHSIGDAAHIREYIGNKELDNLSKIFDEGFKDIHPEFTFHFAEYSPSRVPRMLSRATHINDMSCPNIESISEATQIGSGEFYQLLSEGIQSNYPNTTGLMTWVFKRSWPEVSGIHFVDAFGMPSAQYYFYKRTLEPTHVLLDIKRLLWASGENFPVKVNILNEAQQKSFDETIKVNILDNHFKVVWSKEQKASVKEGTSVMKSNLGDYNIPMDYKEKFFFVEVQLTNNKGHIISHSEYWPRTIKQMDDKRFYNKYIMGPIEWPSLPTGPWLKPTVALNRTDLKVNDISLIEYNQGKGKLKIKISNNGKNPSFMTQIDIVRTWRCCYASDNFFWLNPKESKEIILTFMITEPKNNKLHVNISAWNAKTIEKILKLR